MSEARVERRLAAILAVDVAGYSRLMGEDEEGTLAALRAVRHDVSDPKIKQYLGRIVKTMGDGLLVEFASVVGAVRCAIEIQHAMGERNTGTQTEKRIEFRVGVHQGDIIVEGGDIFGDGVNLAARLENLAAPGGICVSRVVRDEVRDKIDVAFEDLGEQQVKNIARPVRVFAVRLHDRAPARPVARPALPLPEKPSLVVLPFQNMSLDPEQEYFADGMVDEITSAIARLSWLFVIARNSAFTYKAEAIDVKQVAQELGVRYVLEGSVRRAGNRVRITAQLIDTTTSAHIWSDRFEGSLDDVFELQDRVASNVAGSIEPRLRGSEIERANRKLPQSLDAYDLYLRALGQFHTHSWQGALNAVDLLKRALAIDPKYSPAAALIGECCVTQRNYPKAPSLSQAEITESVDLARQAAQWGKDDPDTLWMAAITLSTFAGEHAAAAHLIERALTINPNSAHAWNAKGYVAYRLNQLETAMESFKRAIRLSPLDPLGGYFSGGLAQVNVALGRYNEALEWADRALHEFPDLVFVGRNKVIALAQLGRIDEARGELERWSALDPTLTLAKWQVTAGRHMPTKLRAVAIDSLRKAGMPEG
jgi:adenylate cyclase